LYQYSNRHPPRSLYAGLISACTDHLWNQPKKFGPILCRVWALSTCTFSSFGDQCNPIFQYWALRLSS
jgi:hypothetical protein